MTTITYRGETFKCLEHMSEIKKEAFNGHLFNRFYNKKQMFKFLLEQNEADETDMLGKLSGLVVNNGPDWYIAIYKIEDLDIEDTMFDHMVNDYKEDWCVTWFFVKDDAGQVYLVDTDED